MARRRAADSTFFALYEPLAGAPAIRSVTVLSTNAATAEEAMAVAVAAAECEDRLLVFADGASG